MAWRVFVRAAAALAMAVLFSVCSTGINAAAPQAMFHRPFARPTGPQELRRSYFGALKLPVFASPVRAPAACTQFEAECALERALGTTHDYAALFGAYEARFGGCALTGWALVRSLGAGSFGTTQLLQTPCGMHVAVRSEQALPRHQHGRTNCALLQELAGVYDSPDCMGCIPRHYYSSNLTGACYEEFVQGVPARVFLGKVDMSSAAGVGVVKDLLLDALSTLRHMQRLHILHRDLRFYNVLVRELPTPVPVPRTVIRAPAAGDILQKQPTAVPHFKLVFYDFGGGASPAAPDGPIPRANMIPHTDAYELACEFFNFLRYGSCIEAELIDPPLSPSFDAVIDAATKSFRHLLSTILNDGRSISNTPSHNFTMYRELLTRVVAV